ncbi:MAG: T9SS type A sorting domain-containing protein [Flavobacteriales bacterium]|nr:T9SS type A sorting domain-containing protein [Flavobacteriales bacterium]
MKNLIPTLLFIFAVLISSAQTYEQRRTQYIDSVQTNDYDDAIVLQAYLGDPISQAALDDIYDDFGVRSTIDFELVRLVRVLFLTDGTYDAQILAQMETLPYWINHDDTLHNYWTENHMIMWMSCEWLLHESYGWEVDDHLKQRLLHYLNLKLEVGFYEFYSTTYLPLTVSGLMNLADFAQDPEIRQKAEAVTRKLLGMVLTISNSQGVIYPAAGRNYPRRYINPHGNGISDMLYLTANLGPCPSENSGRLNFLATSGLDFSEFEQQFISETDTLITFGHSVEEGLTRHDSLYYVDELMMQWSSGMYFHPYIAEHTGQLLVDSNFWGHVDFTDLSIISSFPVSQFEAIAIELDEMTVSRSDCEANVALFKNDETVLTSLQDYWKGKIGFQQWPIAANVGGTCVYTASGPVESDWTQRSSVNFNEHLPYIEQDGNVALVMYRPQEVSPILPYNNKDVALHWVDTAFSDITENGNWLFGNRNENYVAVRRACVGEINGVRACETDAGQTWVFVVGNDQMYSSYSNFQNIVSQSVFSETWTSDINGDSTYTASITFDGNTIEYAWGPEPPFTGVNEVQSNSLNVYPNPNNGSFSIQLPEANVQDANLEVYDMMGNLVLSQRVVNQNKVELELESAADGMYLVRLASDQGVWTGRFLKQN